MAGGRSGVATGSVSYTHLDVYKRQSQGSNQAAVQFTYQDRTVVTYVRVLSTVEEIEPTLKLKGLEEDALYRLEGTDQVYSGAELMYAGLTVILPQGDFLSKQYVFVKK